MSKDNRISNFTHMRTLLSDGLQPFPHQAIINESGNKDDDVLFLISESGSHNEKIKYKNLKKSILDNSVLLTGNQLISGEKTFADICTFESTIYINEVVDITQTGDISGNIFVGESGLFDKIGVGLDFTNRRIVKDVYSDFPKDSEDYVEYDFGGGINTGNYLGGLDFGSDGNPDLNTTLSSYSIYEPSGWYNSTIPQSQQNYTGDTSLDGHSFEPDEIHREMGGAWVGVDFEKPFNYKGFSIFRTNISNAAEKLKVVASNNGTDWTTIHRVENLGSGDYSNTGERSDFYLEQYHPDQYSKYRLVAQKLISASSWELAHFSFSGVREHEFVTTIDPQYTLHVSGDSCFLGDITQTGFARQSGDLYRLGNFTQTGDTYIHGNEIVTGDIHLGKTLYHLNDEDTYIAYTDDKIDITAGDGVKVVLNEAEDNKIQFFTNGIEQMRLDESGFLGINTTTPFAELSVTGDSYLECLFTTGEDGLWERVYGGSDEVVTFVTELDAGDDVYKIDFPKTFGEKPSVTLSLENDQGGPIVPYIISGINGHEYYINFGSELLNDGYKIHTSARATGQSAVNKTTTQSFITEITPQANKDIYEIFYPNQFHANPVVSATLEHESTILPYVISGITTASYKIVFGRELHDTCKIHTHAVR